MVRFLYAGFPALFPAEVARCTDSVAFARAVDATKPKTKIQIRFHDGTRKAQEFNEDHTVGDLRGFCAQCVGGQAMTIMGGFPPKAQGRTKGECNLGRVFIRVT
ncbi:PUX4 [Symbiodinium necroappetens]|uniref:PUX4 protein n=1 Tax=Symbiodinium necroappetens TaxID=1628268 RepID=A0A812KSE0_9DINO|nr:PUX4 [Symbiodinium necroappetens]